MNFKLRLINLSISFHFFFLTGDISGGREENDRGLFPPTFNLAYSAIISANATCGEKGEEMFCKLVEHVRYGSGSFFSLSLSLNFVFRTVFECFIERNNGTFLLRMFRGRM